MQKSPPMDGRYLQPMASPNHRLAPTADQTGVQHNDNGNDSNADQHYDSDNLAMVDL